MTIYSGIFNSINGDRKYNAWWFAKYFATFIGNGVFPNPSTGLQVMADERMQVKVRPGSGWIDGYFLYSDTDHVLKLDVADGVLKRIDRIVMRLDYLTRKIDIVVKKGVLSSKPTAPTLQRDTDYVELALADVAITNGTTIITQADITDTRLNKTLCGIVHGTVNQVDTTTLFNQYQSWITQQKEAYETDLATWTKAKKLSFDEWVATQQKEFDEWLATENTALSEWRDGQQTDFTSWRDVQKSDFDNWFETIKGVLDGDIAATLTAKVAALETHANDKNNPHGVTKSQVGLASVLNYGVATQAEAEAGTSNAKYMTPLSTKQAITKQAATLVTTHVDDKTNPHGVTKTQVGLGSVQNYGLATTSEAITGTSNAKYMTPLRTKEAITNTAGTLSSLKTNSKADLVSAVNEVFTNGNNVKKNTVDALLSVDDKLPITQNSNWDSIIANIGNIATGKKWASGTAETGSVAAVRFEELDFSPSFFIAIQIGVGSNSSGSSRHRGLVATATKERIYGAKDSFNNGAVATTYNKLDSDVGYFTVDWTKNGSIRLEGSIIFNGLLFRWYIFE